MKILLAEDDARLGELMQMMLKNHNFSVDWVEDGETAMYYATNAEYDLLLLDWMMPNKNGVEVCMQLRRDGYQGGIIIFTAKDAVQEIVKALDAGADDYLVKPFESVELLARIRALGRRREGKLKEDIVHIADLELDRTTKAVRRSGKKIQLSSREFQVLDLLAQNRGRVLPRELILERIWGENSFVTSNNLDAHVKLLRKKLESPEAKALIQNVRGIGFRLGEQDVHENPK